MPLPDWSPVFFAALTRSPNVAAAAEQAGITKQWVYKLRSEDPEFASAWADALDTGIQELEGRVWKRACDSSDKLAIFLLKAHKPAVYREQVDVKHGGTIQLEWTDVEIREPEPEDAPAPSGATGGEAVAC